MLSTAYLDSIKKQFAYYKLLGEKTFDQVSDDKLFWQFNRESNSIAPMKKSLHSPNTKNILRTNI
ncbi:DUF1572 family protein [Spirosoma litoris]